MPSTFLGLMTGTSGLYTYQASINVTANNAANVETKGYTRQESIRKASDALRAYTTYGQIGTGVVCTGVEQIRNQYYDKKLWSNNTKYGEYNVKNYYMQQIDSLFYEKDKTTSGFTSVYGKLAAAIDDLANDGTSTAKRTSFANVAQQFAEYFNSAAESLKNMQLDANNEIESYVHDINSLAQDIYALNQQINVIELAGGTANELRDQRALIIDRLSEIVPVEIEEQNILSNDGTTTGATAYIVYICGQKLVDKESYAQLQCVARKSNVNISDAEGLYDIKWDDGSTLNIAHTSISGKLNALFQIRDGNNADPFKGTLDSVAADGTITVTTYTYANQNQISLNNSGIIKLGNKEFKYDGYKSVDNGDGTFTFEIKVTDATQQELLNYVNRTAQVGANIDYCGIPYYMSQLDEFVRGFSQALNSIFLTGEDANGNDGCIIFTGTDVSGDEYDFAVSGLINSISQNGLTVEIAAGADETAVPQASGKIYINHKAYEYTSYTYNAATNTYTYTMDANSAVDTAYVGKNADNYSLNVDSTTDTYNKITASNFRVRTDVLKDTSLIATTDSNHANTDAGFIMDKIYNLLSDKSQLAFRGASISEFITCIVSDISVDAEKVSTFEKNYYDVCQTINRQRLSVSGVDKDEEASNLIEFKNAYDLSAKVIQVMTEIYDKLIQETGV